MVNLGNVVGKVVKSMTKPKGQVLDDKFVDRMMEKYGFLRSVAGDADFDRAVNALCVAAGSDRGILVTGQNGCGKTQFLKAVRQLTIVDSVWLSCADEIDLQLLENCFFSDCNMFLDDLGAERFLYGDLDRVGNFICRWYDRRDPHRLLMVSTNLTGSEIDERYGGRVFDRLRELCVILPMTGKSKREEIVIKK